MIAAPEAIRRRAAMYIGDTSVNRLHWLVRDFLDVPLNPSRITLRLAPDAVRLVAEAVPLSVLPRAEGRPPFIVEVCTMLMTSLDEPPTLAGVEELDESVSPAVFQRTGTAPSSLTIANALSSEFSIASCRSGRCSRVVFRRGEITSPLAASETDSPDGITICFSPDREIFADTSLRFYLLARIARDAALLRRVPIEVRDETSNAVFLVDGSHAVR